MDKIRDFLCSTAGRVVLTVILYILIWGTLIALLSSEFIFLVIPIIVVCVILGWRVISECLPDVRYRTMKSVIIYLIVKIFFSWIVGIFTAPYVIGKWLSEKIEEKL